MSAQKKENQDVNFYLGVGISSFRPIWKDINTFTESYNANFGAELTQPFTMFESKMSPIFEAGIGLGNRIDVGVRVQLPVSYSNNSRFANGEGRELKFVSKWSDLYMNFNMFRIWKIYLGTNFGAIFSSGSLYSGYRYSNDFISYNSEKRLNAIFEIKKPLYTGGFQLYFIPQKNIGITVMYQRVGILNRKSTITAASGELKDNLDGLGTFYSNHEYTTYQAIDYVSSTNAYTYFVGLGNTADAAIKGNRITINARVNLKLVNEKNHK